MLHKSTQKLFRDPRSKVLKTKSEAVDCDTEASHHIINGNIYSQSPHLELQTHLNVTKLKPDFEKDDIITSTFRMLSTMYGNSLDQLQKALLLGSRKLTIAAEWAGKYLFIAFT